MVSGDPQDSDGLANLDMAPPGYGEHQFDQLYSDVDTTGYATPNASGFNTPFGNNSRQTSVENLASLDTSTNGQLLANTLHNRLNNLTNPVSSRWSRDHTNTSGPSTPAHGILESMAGAGQASQGRPVSAGDYFTRANHDNHARNNASTLFQRSSAESSGPVTSNYLSHPEPSQHLEYNYEALAKVPSYGTALRSSLPRESGDDLPNYEQVSRTPSLPMESEGTGESDSGDERQHADRHRYLYHHNHHFGNQAGSHEGDRRVRLLPVRGRS